eukprot:snap_masked-scaffold_21-processed-gene-4.5-mRNA-1 protein AED:1.00 eAED:1.00 QI:0/0/0/0/1/1/2/0/189
MSYVSLFFPHGMENKVNYIYSSGQVITGLDIFAYSDTLEGESSTLARAGPCGFIEDQPRFRIVHFDSANMDYMVDKDLFLHVAKHGITHVIGFGTLWEDYGLIKNPSIEWTKYTGEHGKKLYEANGGKGNIPLCSNKGNWRETEFGNELISPSITIGDISLSTISIISLRDLGYRAITKHADDYTFQRE